MGKELDDMVIDIKLQIHYHKRKIKDRKEVDDFKSAWEHQISINTLEHMLIKIDPNLLNY